MIKVVGRMNLFHNQRSINAFNFDVIDPFKDEMGQYMHFMIEAVYAHITNTAPKQHIAKMKQMNMNIQNEFNQQRKAYYDQNAQNAQNSNSPNRNSNNYGSGGYNNDNNNNNHNHNHNNRDSGNGGYNNRYPSRNNMNQSRNRDNYHQSNHNRGRNSYGSAFAGNDNRNYKRNSSGNNGNYGGGNNINNNNGNINRRDSVVTKMDNNDYLRLKARIFNIISSYSNDEGCSKTEILRKISNESVPDIETALEIMNERSEIFTTIDEEHYKIVQLD